MDSINSIHTQEGRILIEPKARPRPLIGRSTQPSFDGVAVHGVELRQTLRRTKDIEGVKAPPPDPIG